MWFSFRTRLTQWENQHYVETNFTKMAWLWDHRASTRHSLEVQIVTERMPSESLLNSDSLSCRTYVFAQDRLAPVRSSASIALACKNPVLRPDVGTTFSPLRQSVRESRMDWHWLLR